MKITLQKTGREKKLERIPDWLVYEKIDGVPIYYRDYDRVLSGEKDPGEVMGSGLIHALILEVILGFLFKELKPKGYLILTGEVGFKVDSKSWYNLDVAVYRKGDIKQISEGLIEIPPRMVIEIDTKADLRKFSSPLEYFHKKTENLLNAGVEKVIWIFTKEKKLWYAERGKDWVITNWNKSLPLLEGIEMNLQNLLEKEKIKI